MNSSTSSIFPIIWNYGPDFFHIGSLSIKFYSLFFASCFIIGRQLGVYFYKSEGRDTKDVDLLITYMMLGTTLGARLGHVIFYEWSYYSHNLLEILLPFKFYPKFKFQGFSGLASHGAMVGIITAMFLYCKCKFDISLSSLRFKLRFTTRPNQNFLWVLDKIAIAVALSGCLIRLGNFMNSEIYGHPTDSNHGVIFVRDVVNKIEDSGKFIDKVSVNCIDNSPKEDKSIFRPIVMQIKFKEAVSDEDSIKSFLDGRIKHILCTGYHARDNIYESPDKPLIYSIGKSNGAYYAKIYTVGIVRHPSQLYESISCLLVFILLFSIWYKYKKTIREGVLSGLFIIIIFTLRIFYEILKGGEVVFSNDWLSITTAQMLSIPAVVFGIILYFWNYKRNRLQ